jgi:hypothetical protein
MCTNSTESNVIISWFLILTTYVTLTLTHFSHLREFYFRINDTGFLRMKSSHPLSPNHTQQLNKHPTFSKNIPSPYFHRPPILRTVHNTWNPSASSVYPLLRSVNSYSGIGEGETCRTAISTHSTELDSLDTSGPNHNTLHAIYRIAFVWTKER